MRDEMWAVTFVIERDFEEENLGLGRGARGKMGTRGP